MVALDLVGVVAAWLGGALVVLSDGRRGVALGIALYAAGLASTVLADPLAAVALALAGLVSAGLRLRDGRSGWGTLPPGSTPRLLLCVVSGVLAAYAGASLLEGPGPAPARVAILLGGALGVARLLSTTRRGAALAAATVMTLAVGGAEAAIGASQVAATVVLAAAIAAMLLGLLPAAEGEPGGA